MVAEADRRGWSRSVASWVLGALLLAAVVSQAGSLHLPGPGDVRKSGWLPVALLAELGSMFAAVCVQRAVLAEAARPPRLPTLARLTLAATAIGYLLPGGPALATAWTARQYGRRGVERDAAAGGQVVTALWIAAALCSAGTVAFLVTDRSGFPDEVGPTAWRVFGAVSVVGSLTSLVALILVRRPGARRWFVGARLVRLLAGEKSGEPSAEDRALLGVTATVLAGVGTLAVFALDFGCLMAWLAACAVPAHLGSVLAAYAITAVVSLLPLTPGGLGLVEGGLIGLIVVPAAASDRLQVAVLGYRLVSYWFVIIVGLISFAFEQWRSRDRYRRVIQSPAA